MRKFRPIDLLLRELVSSILSVTLRSASVCVYLLRGKGVCLRCSSNFSGLRICNLIRVPCSSCSSSAI